MATMKPHKTQTVVLALGLFIEPAHPGHARTIEGIKNITKKRNFFIRVDR